MRMMNGLIESEMLVSKNRLFTLKPCKYSAKKIIAEEKFAKKTNLLELFICVYITIDIEL